MASSYFWVIWQAGNTASVSGPGAKPAAPKGGRVFGPYNTQAEAETGVQKAIAADGKSGNLLSAAGAAVNPANLVSGVTGGLQQVGSFFGALSQGSTWIRVGEVVLGLVLLAIGVARITHAVPIATTVAKTAGAVAI